MEGKGKGTIIGCSREIRSVIESERDGDDGKEGIVSFGYWGIGIRYSGIRYNGIRYSNALHTKITKTHKNQISMTRQISISLYGHT